MNKELLWVCIAPIPVIVIVQRLFIGWMKRMHARGRAAMLRTRADATTPPATPASPCGRARLWVSAS